MTPVMHSNSINHVLITIGICTYRRPDELALLLDGIINQTFKKIPKPKLSIVVVDNEVSNKAKDICDFFRAQDTGISLVYAEEPVRGISHARNKVLSLVPKDCEYLALIDDDEIPCQQWLEQLFVTRLATNAEVVRGPVFPCFPPDTPTWIVNGEYFGWPGKRKLSDKQPLGSVATNNVLMYWPVIASLGPQFDPELAFTGGEDVVFFEGLKKHGVSFAYAKHAAVYEYIPPERISLISLLRLNYRYGNNRLAKVVRLSKESSHGKSLFFIIPIQIWKAIKNIVSGIISIPIKMPRAKTPDAAFGPGFVKIARGIGLISGMFGIKYKYYK